MNPDDYQADPDLLRPWRDVRAQIRHILTTTEPKMQRAYTQPEDVPFSAATVTDAVAKLRQQSIDRKGEPCGCVVCLYNAGDLEAIRPYFAPWKMAIMEADQRAATVRHSIATMQTNTWADRHPSVSHFAPLFQYDHLPPHLQPVSRVFAQAAQEILTLCPTDGPELTVTLRKLWEAKNSAVVHNGFCQNPK